MAGGVRDEAHRRHFRHLLRAPRSTRRRCTGFSALVFLRFLEDNRLLDRPIVAGPGERLELAQLRQRRMVPHRPEDSDAEYLLATFAEVARPARSGRPVRPGAQPALPPARLGRRSDRAVRFLSRSARRTPAHCSTTSPTPTGTRASSATSTRTCRRRRASATRCCRRRSSSRTGSSSRTLDPAIHEFGHEQVRMIDPTCGSGHFLLGGFARLLEEWRRHAPECRRRRRRSGRWTRWRAWTSTLSPSRSRASGCCWRRCVPAARTRLAAAPDFRFSSPSGTACCTGGISRSASSAATDEGFRRRLRHHYAAEDTAALDAILGRQYHAVVGNPPYITPKDAAMRDAYREIYVSCHMNMGWARRSPSGSSTLRSRERGSGGGLRRADRRQ